ncbi:alpha/beta fold hydrolase [Candidatus Dojkabacteria bacterium]|nr:alpha/beta fold hydrolase [Candidatus Dojkabacteria bacterium]
MNKIGKGPNLIFFHGGGVRYNSYLPLMKALSSHYTVYYFDLPGHGSEMTNGNPIDAVNKLTQKIKNYSIGNPILLGHSFGGFCAYEVSKNLEDINQVILLNPLLIESKKNFLYLLFRFLILKNIRSIIMKPMIIKFYIKAFMDILINIFSQNINLVNTIKLLLNSTYCTKTPLNQSNPKTVILHGKHDSIIPYNNFQDGFKKITNLVDGEHDWCMNNVEDTVRKILKVAT